MITRLYCCVIAVSCFALPCAAQEMMQETGAVSAELTQEQTDFFESKIRPVLARECYSCHSKQTGQSRGGLQLDTREGLLGGGDTGAGLEPGDPDNSLLISAIAYDEFAMPPNRQLSDKILQDFRDWVEMGAPDPRVVTNAERDYTATISSDDIKAARKTWTYSPPEKVDPPSVKNTQWVRSPIDNFVLAGLEQSSLAPSEDAEPLSLVRRLSYDLTGLPPSQEQIDWFLKAWDADQEKAVAIVVDGLLKSERFGERWGRHWLDVARYAESTGRESNATYPHAWRYRDYVIDAFNEDKPYDQFIREQIAGDLLPARDEDQWADNLTATGFLALGPKSLREQNPRQFQMDLVDEQLDVSTRVVLGLSVACARCHDHKFDPIPQDDYYAMSGIFMSTSTHYGTANNRQNRRASNLIQLPVSDPDPYLTKVSAQEVEEWKTDFSEKSDQYRQARRQRAMNRRNPGSPMALTQQQENRLGTEVSMLEQLINSYDDEGNPLTFVMAVQDRQTPVNARVLIRGEVDQPSDEVERGFVQVLSSRKHKLDPETSGRLELAEWMTDEKNPLTARVMVNRIWKHLLGEGIIRSTENFGSTSEPASHPELLDYLAVDFMENDWSVKELIRKIATSHTYRQGSRFNASAFEEDPENKLLWRYTPRRLDAEAIRDTMLFASGQLTLDRPRGSTVTKAGPTVVRDGRLTSAIELLKTIRDNEIDTTPGAGTDARRRSNGRQVRQLMEELQFEIDDSRVNYRSVYLPVIRDNLPIAMEAFDFAAPSMVVGARGTTNSPTQALYMMNDEFVLRQSSEMARSIIKEFRTTESRLNAVFKRIYGRDATENELTATKKFFSAFSVQAAAEQERADSRSGRERENRSSRRRAAQYNRNNDSSGRTAGKAEVKLAAVCQAVFASADFRFLE